MVRDLQLSAKTAELDLRLVEADQVCTPDLVSLDVPAVDGIVFERAGNPVEYHVLKQHPGDTARQYFLEYDRLPADSVLHWFRADRPGQARGIPDIMPALPLFAQLRRFTLAVIAAASRPPTSPAFSTPTRPRAARRMRPNPSSRSNWSSERSSPCPAAGRCRSCKRSNLRRDTPSSSTRS
jgi:hypothetical protein